MIVAYFWWKNTQGIHESSQKALQIMTITTAMVVILIVWCMVTLLAFACCGASESVESRRDGLSPESRWAGFTGTGRPTLTIIIAFVGFGHSVLAMSGEETLAQVSREIEHPKLKNLKKTGVVIFVYSLLFTSLVSFFAVMIIPDNVRPDSSRNMIGGIAMYLVGPQWIKLIFHGFVVIVGVLILAGAQNTPSLARTGC